MNVVIISKEKYEEMVIINNKNKIKNERSNYLERKV